MTPSDGPQILERLTWEGVVGAPTALAIGTVLAMLMAWALWRERHALGRGWAAAFWALRCTALGCAIWMMAGPTQQRIERTTTPQSIAIFADGSESMDVVDPPDPADALRWALAIEGDADKSPVGVCDRLGVALGVALADCDRFTAHLNEHRPPKQLEAILTSIESTIERSSSHAQALVAWLEGRDASLAERASRIASLVDGPVTGALAENRSALETSGQAIGAVFTVRHEQLVEGIMSARRRALVLAADLAQRQDSDAVTSTAETDGLSRREKAGRALDALERQLGDSRAGNVRFERYRFDRTAMPVSVDADWAQALEIAPTPADGSSRDAMVTDAAVRDASTTAGPATNLTSVLDQLTNKRSGHSLRLALILSDGRHNDSDAEPPQEVASQLTNVPIYVVPVGNSIQLRDVLLHRVEAPAAVAEKDSAVIDVIVTGFDCEGQSTTAVLRQQGREIDRKPIEFSGNRGDNRVRFIVPSKEPGWQEYVVEVEPVQEETNTANNYQAVSFEVVRERIRGLLADSVARWEYRYLSQLFRRDEHVQFDDLLFSPRVHGTGNLADRPEFPRDVDGWARYDVAILGDIDPRQLPADSQHALDEFVRTRGGDLILVAGHNAMPRAFEGEPLMELLPVERSTSVLAEQGYMLRLTEEGRLNSALLIADSAQDSQDEWHQIYDRFPVFGLSDYSRPKASARTLIEAVSGAAGDVATDDGGREIEHAFLCWQRVGAGRVAYLAAPDTYRLRWRRGDRMHHRFWGQFLRWITATNAGAGSDVVRLHTNRTRYAEGEPVEVTIWLKDSAGRPLAGETISAEATAFNNEAVNMELTPDPDVDGRYFGTFADLAAGAYRIGVRGSIIDKLLPAASDADQVRATITVRASDSIEMLNTQCNRALLEQVAQMTGGQVIPPTAIGEVLKLVSFAPEVSERIERTPLWNRWSNLFVVLGCLFTEWIVRKGKGFV